MSRHYDVTLIGSRPHADAVNSKGLLISGDIEGTFYLKADTQIRNIPDRALVVLTTKVQDSAKAIEGNRSLFKKDTVVLILQNGLSNEDIVRSAVSNQVTILRGVLKLSAEFSAPGEVKFWNGKTIIEKGEGASEIVEMLNRCGLEARLSENIAKDVWNKLVVNCVVNPLTAILRVRDGEIITDSLNPVRSEIVSECVAVAKAEGMVLPADLREKIDRSVAGYGNFSSMYQDIVRGRKTEIDFLNWKIVELGTKHGIATPVNATLTSLIKYLEGGNAVSGKD